MTQKNQDLGKTEKSFASLTNQQQEPALRGREEMMTDKSGSGIDQERSTARTEARASSQLRRRDFGPLDTEEQVREAMRLIGLAVMEAGNALMQLEKPTGLGGTRFDLTEEQQQRVEARRQELRELNTIRSEIRKRLVDILNRPNDVYKASLTRAIRELAPERYEAILHRADVLEQEAKQRRAVTTTVGSAVGVRGSSGGMRRRAGE